MDSEILIYFCIAKASDRATSEILTSAMRKTMKNIVLVMFQYREREIGTTGQ